MITRVKKRLRTIHWGKVHYVAGLVLAFMLGAAVMNGKVTQHALEQKQIEEQSFLDGQSWWYTHVWAKKYCGSFYRG